MYRQRRRRPKAARSRRPLRPRRPPGRKIRRSNSIDWANRQPGWHVLSFKRRAWWPSFHALRLKLRTCHPIAIAAPGRKPTARRLSCLHGNRAANADLLARRSLAAPGQLAQPVCTPTTHYHPLVVVLSASATGMVFDRYRPLPLPAWLGIAAAAIAAWTFLSRRGRHVAASVGLLLATASLAAAWHHDRWNLFGADDIGLFARSQQEPVCFEAVALQTPRPAIGTTAPQTNNPLHIAWLDDEVRLTVELQAIRDGEEWRSASGCAVVAIEGPVPDLLADDRFRAFGHLMPPDHALNPGETDRALQDRGRRVTAHLRVTYPEAITVLTGKRTTGPGAWLESLRLRGRRIFQRYLEPRQANLAAAVLLGLREQIDPEESEAFQLTGTVHLLVIAGLHLGIIAGFASIVFRRLLPQRFGMPTTAAFVVAYMLLVDAQPPIVRATVLIVAACTAVYLGRQRISFNVLALRRIDRAGGQSERPVQRRAAAFLLVRSRADGPRTAVARTCAGKGPVGRRGVDYRIELAQ